MTMKNKKANTRFSYFPIRDSKKLKVNFSNVLTSLRFPIRDSKKANTRFSYFPIRDSKKANIPITIFVLGILLICGLTIGSFTILKTNQKKEVLAIGVEDMNSIIEKFYFYKKIGKTNEQAIELIKISDEDFPRNISLEKNEILVIKSFIPKKEDPNLKITYKKIP